MSRAYTAKGAALHMPPEMYETEQVYTDRADIFSLGVILY